MFYFYNNLKQTKHSMKTIILLFLSMSAFTFNSCAQKDKAVPTKNKAEIKSIYQFKVTDISGETFDLSSLKGKKVLIVNTASKCGLTPQYEGLEELYKKYKAEGFTIVGFPANNFLSQEPGSDEDIATFCQKNYGVSFPMMSKISVKGKDMHEVYQYLTTANLNGLEDNKVGWNFQKYLINEEGFLEKVISPKTKPLDAEIVDWVKK
ncbi:MAG: glutathione peroxidase [Planctomycetota bacterium]|jgi:glutathione peroxidase